MYFQWNTKDMHKIKGTKSCVFRRRTKLITNTGKGEKVVQVSVASDCVLKIQNQNPTNQVLVTLHIPYKMICSAFNRPDCHLPLEMFYPVSFALQKQDYIISTPLETYQIEFKHDPNPWIQYDTTLLFLNFKIHILEVTELCLPLSWSRRNKKVFLLFPLSYLLIK